MANVIGLFWTVCFTFVLLNSRISFTSCSLTVRFEPDVLPLVIDRERGESIAEPGENHRRARRDAQTSNLRTEPKISKLNDSHHQLMVDWVGVGSTVVICLARNNKGRGPTVPSAVYISYDYGDSFHNRTEAFVLKDKGFAALDRFYSHRKFISLVVFVDAENKAIFTTLDAGKTIERVDLEFHPSEITFLDSQPFTFLSFDKLDPLRKLWLTKDFGQTWEVVQESVKSYALWTPGPASLLPSVVPTKNYEFSNDESSLLFVLREEPSGKGTVLSSPNLFSGNGVLKVWMSNVDELQIKGDFMFATKSDNKGGKDLYISYKRGPLVRAIFYTELIRKHYYIADVSDGQVFVAVAHTDTVTNLYSSLSIDAEKVSFGLSLERIFCYFPNETWTDSFLPDLEAEAFADIHKVEGLRGIYIATYVANGTDAALIGPQHLTTVITFDRGVTWRPLTPPVFDDDGQPIKCNLAAGCSLHLSQKFDQLYPGKRAVPILTSASAPGIILATGTIGKFMKGRPGVYLSRDGGLTWRQILKDYYFFNFGDHGGVLTAVKYYRSNGETREFLYSTDEGENFKSLQLPLTEDLRVYGLMTEPGFNTTVFTMFGSLPGLHQWLIVKVDLRDAFERNCSDDDYKFWSPHSEKGPRVSCIMGRKETFERRKAISNCFNGRNFNRPIRVEVCECDSEDFECDIGFENSLGSKQCVRDKSKSADPYVVPSTCKPGQFYNRTKGYRRIPSDVCVGGRENLYAPDQIPCPLQEKKEFLLVAQRDKIARIDLKDVDVRMETLPITHLKNVIAIEFDMRNNCVYWADIVRDVIGRQCFSDGKSYPEILVENNLTSIEGMALDWVSNNLYFVDGVAAKISLIRTNIPRQGRMRREILDKRTLSKPRGIAVHPMQGYLFWTDWEMTQPSVSRSNLDGSNVKRLFTRPSVEWPNGLTIDHIAERLYWVDARKDYIASSDLSGENFRKIISQDEHVSHPFAVAVFKDIMYWDDWKKSSIFAADKDHGLDIRSILTGLPGLMDIKVFAHSIQEGTNACGHNETNKCTHICVGAPEGKHTCLCPQNMVMTNNVCLCPGKKLPGPNGTCPMINSKCEANYFRCPEMSCIPYLWVCDGESDCADGADEKNCSKPTCLSNMHRCPDDHCIPKTWLCDHDQDCNDGSDEKNCTYETCKSGHFRCGNGRCIPDSWRCDLEDDCDDGGSDERGCNITITATCKPGEFRCGHKCIPLTWKCDGDRDCAGGEDESDCQGQHCPKWQFQCANQRCIIEAWVCDGEDDCKDGSDEKNCTKHEDVLPPHLRPTEENCYDWSFRCRTDSRCIPFWWKCDGVNDCPDKSDEIGCDSTTTTTQSPKEQPSEPSHCKSHQFRCASDECIQQSWVCDGMKDCDGGEDEAHCHDLGCLKNEFMCRTDGSCIFQKQVCDGHKHCPDGSDEESCSRDTDNSSSVAGPSCAAGYFSCDAASCIPLERLCNGHEDCYDGSDEANCNPNRRIYQVLDLTVDTRHVTSSSFVVYWSAPSSDGLKFQYLPSLGRINTSSKTQSWSNSSWTESTRYSFNGLQPYTSYNFTVYVRKVNDSKNVFPPASYVSVMTDESAPSPPVNVSVIQKSSGSLEVSWSPPVTPNGHTRIYSVFVSPPLPPSVLNFPRIEHEPKEYEAEIAVDVSHGANYTVWVVAANSKFESPHSKTASVQFDAHLFIDSFDNRDSNMTVIGSTETSLTLKWDEFKDARSYSIRIKSPAGYPSHEILHTTDSSITVTRLSPGTTYNFELSVLGKLSTPFSRSNQVGTTRGSKLTKITGLHIVSSTTNSVALAWNDFKPPDRPSIAWRYGIFYGTNYNELQKSTYVASDRNVFVLENLSPCQSYLICVSVVEPLGSGPLSEPVSVMTKMDVTAPPDQISATRDSKDPSVMVLDWETSCRQAPEPVEYQITIYDVIKNKASVSTLARSDAISLSHKIKVNYGANYNVSITTTEIGSRPTGFVYHAPPIPSPIETHASRNDNGSYTLGWSAPPNLPESIKRYYFVVIISKRDESNSSKIYETKIPLFTFTDIAENAIYSFAVKLVTDTGYESAYSDVTSFSAVSQGALQNGVTSSGLVSVLVPSLLVLFVLIGIAAVFVVRHRRLQRPFFTNFSNSRYDRRSGSTTFGGPDGLEDEDSPVIRGFSDDEPLVIA